jgi:carboxypeptidase family protein
VAASFESMRTVVDNVDPTAHKELVIALDEQPKGIVFGTIIGYPPDFGNATIVKRTVVALASGHDSETTIDDAGNYRMEDAPIGRVMVWAQIDSSANGFRQTAPKEVDVVSGQPMRVDLELGGDVHVTGRVSFEGKSLDGAVVSFSGDRSRGGLSNTRTNSEGMYELTLPAEGLYGISVMAEQVTSTFEIAREVHSGERIDLDLREETIEGVVVEAATRRPVANALIAVGDPRDVFPSLGRETRSDGSGHFRMSTMRAPMLLYVSASGYAPRTLNADTAAQMVVELDPAAELRVRVVDAKSGAPLEARILVQDVRGAYVVSLPEHSADGATYRFSLSPSTKYRISIRAEGYTERKIEVTAPGSIEVRME